MTDLKILIENIKNLIAENNINQSQEDAWWILEFITKKNRAQLLSQKTILLTIDQKKLLDSIIFEYKNNNKPLQYILGTVPFGDLTIIVKPPILIPRPETENWCYDIIDKLKTIKKQKFTILDLCSGSGCIGLAFAKAFKDSIVYAADISEIACELTKENAKLNKIDNIFVYKSNLFENINREIKFDLIVSNPPYISLDQWQKLDPSVKNWEDFNALVAKEEGLEIIENIIIKAKNHLKSRDDFKKADIPELAIEIDYTQGPKVKELLERNGYKNIKILKDLYNNDRLGTANI